MGILSRKQPCKAMQMNFAKWKEAQKNPKAWNIWIALQSFVANAGEHFHGGGILTF